ncbi:hypothetical protein GCM10010923_22210 [Blastomonas marina]|uniref:Tip attachment protein J domain-containing protein n=1 Tax=Blastomonas marina TaxID=1867408 RepID=A0ABQ1FGN8_9SPHN|nr:phage tail protein [Blastomonas marina]GGA11150.1 hypothetical protein GCM10010923_22210 [Blastomonas marina]
MATLALTAVGTLVGGPLGGAIGALAGRAIDSAFIGSTSREGPRLAELALSTSSYGQPIAQVHGTMRAGGSIIWATDLREDSTVEGDGKGRPSTTTYSYSASFAVALSSRPIVRLGRVWADGNLLRGAAGDLKVGGTIRVHSGGADQLPDPLIAADKGASCPAFRGIAYAVFEDLQLADYGNRIPALSFEIVADDGAISLAWLAGGAVDGNAVALDAFGGFALEGAPVAALETLAQLVPMDCDGAGDRLAVRASGTAIPVPLSAPARARGEDRFAPATGQSRRRLPPDRRSLGALRYYDPARDYQPGQQRAPGPVPDGEPQVLEVPAALHAADARALIAAAARRQTNGREMRLWRDATLDPGLGPGSVVTLPDEPGLWRVAGWEWRAEGVEFELVRMVPGDVAAIAASPGQGPTLPDHPMPPTWMSAFELPWDGYGDGAAPRVHAALSADHALWSGAALFAVEPGGALRSLGASGRRRAIAGTTLDPLPPGSSILFDRAARVRVQLLDPEFALASATPELLAFGDNRALIGREIVQFACAEPLGGGVVELSVLLRGRGGTEHLTLDHAAGERFVLLDGAGLAIDPARLGGEGELAAIGLADPDPVTGSIANAGISTRPLCPVHPRLRIAADGSLEWRWTRRARGAWAWRDEVDVPLNEQVEAYQVGFGDPDMPVARWDVAAPVFTLSASELAVLGEVAPAGRFFVRQSGDHAMSLPLLLPRP